MPAARTLVHKGALPVLKRIAILWFLLLWDTCPQDSPDCLLLQKILNVQFRLWFYVSLFSDNQNISVLQSDITRPKFYSFRYNGALICMPDKRSPVSGLLPDQNCRIRKLKMFYGICILHVHRFKWSILLHFPVSPPRIAQSIYK